MMNRNILNPMMWTTGGGPTPIDYGIYWKPSLGLISVSDNGEDWITISDKNLGATQVYNNGDTLTAENCGNYFQRGNNYGFPFSGPTRLDPTRIDVTNYGPYYEDSTFRITDYDEADWASVGNPNLWGDEALTNKQKARIGPATNYWRDWWTDELFGYVPTAEEWESLYNIMRNIGLLNPQNYQSYLLMPPSGSINTNGEKIDLGDMGYYWAATSSNFGHAKFFGFGRTSYDFTTRGKGIGMPIRCFFSVPSRVWDDEITLYNNPGVGYIKWSPSREIIRLQDNTQSKSIAILDKNLGATRIYQDGAELIGGNCGGYFQWGNNYMFPFNGEVTTSSTKVDASNYGPYYFSNVFRTTNYATQGMRAYPWNDNLWGGGRDKPVFNYKTMRGPCPTGYHIPQHSFELIPDMLNNLGINTTNYNCLKTYLKMPPAGYMWTNTIQGLGERCDYHTSFGYEYGIAPLRGDESSMSWGRGSHDNTGKPIRPFKNEPVVPDSTWTKLY